MTQRFINRSLFLLSAVYIVAQVVFHPSKNCIQNQLRKQTFLCLLCAIDSIGLDTVECGNQWRFRCCCYETETVGVILRKLIVQKTRKREGRRQCLPAASFMLRKNRDRRTSWREEHWKNQQRKLQISGHRKGTFFRPLFQFCGDVSN